MKKMINHQDTKGTKYGKRKEVLLFFLAFLVSWCLGGSRGFSLGTEETATLKYTYKTDQAQVALLRDMKQQAYFPLTEVAKFYGIQVDFDPQTRRVTLSKGKNHVRLVLSQSVFLTADPEESLPIQPLEMVEGQIGVPPESAEDLLGAVLNLNVRYVTEEGSLVAGGVQIAAVRQEILAQSQPQPTPVPTLLPPPVPTQALVEPTPEPMAPQTHPRPRPPLGGGLQVRRIIIDAGHGGNDSGAKGRFSGTLEKDATLAIAKEVVGLLKQEGDLEVLMSRKDDHYVALKERTEFANRHGGDLFVSIHCNSNPNREARGTEIYVYNSKASNKLAAMAALRENFRGNYKALILADLHNQKYVEASYCLAEKMESLVRERLKQHFRKILRGPFYVLGAVDMPSILVETAFISNPEEEGKLRDQAWRKQIGKVIADGILAYRDQVEGSFENQHAQR